jgi:penicillin-binding protein 2
MNRQRLNRDRAFTRRAAILAGGKLALMSLLGGRLYYLQVVDADQYRVLAEENRINLRLLAPPRGRILDRFGAELAVNRQNSRLVRAAEQRPATSRRRSPRSPPSCRWTRPSASASSPRSRASAGSCR